MPRWFSIRSSRSPVSTIRGRPATTTPGYSANVTVTGPNAFTVTYHDPDGTMTAAEIREQVIREMEAYTGLKVRSYSYPGSGIMVFEDGSTFGAMATVTPQAQVALKLDGKVLSYVNASSTVSSAGAATWSRSEYSKIS